MAMIMPTIHEVVVERNPGAENILHHPSPDEEPGNGSKHRKQDEPEPQAEETDRQADQGQDDSDEKLLHGLAAPPNECPEPVRTRSPAIPVTPMERCRETTPLSFALYVHVPRSQWVARW